MGDTGRGIGKGSMAPAPEATPLSKKGNLATYDPKEVIERLGTDEDPIDEKTLYEQIMSLFRPTPKEE